MEQRPAEDTPQSLDRDAVLATYPWADKLLMRWGIPRDQVTVKVAHDYDVYLHYRGGILGISRIMQGVGDRNGRYWATFEGPCVRCGKRPAHGAYMSLEELEAALAASDEGSFYCMECHEAG